MRKISKIPYIRKIQHIKYVEKSVVEQRNKVISSSLMFGRVNPLDRELFFKYNDYLVKLKQK